ncbi:MAG: DUF2845 domain-containing protein [Deltaproteobacteria bacterium]|nr:DUF2845 domain-containing protein [Deltaproteobacteria bacterium]
MNLKPIIIGLTLALAIPATSFAAMHCGGGWIHVGDSAGKILKRCGKPHYKTTTKIGLSSHEEVWYYEFSGKLPHTVTIRDGKVIKIEVD